MGPDQIGALLVISVLAICIFSIRHETGGSEDLLSAQFFFPTYCLEMQANQRCCCPVKYTSMCPGLM